MKRNHLILIILILAGFSVQAEMITKIAVLDYSRVLSSFYKESKAIRDLEDEKKENEAEVKKMHAEILKLEERKLSAEMDGKKTTALQLEKQIFDKKEQLNEFIRIKNYQLNEKAEKLSSSVELLQEIKEAVQYVCETEGYMLVLDKKASDLIWYSIEVDITDLVLKRLIQTNR